VTVTAVLPTTQLALHAVIEPDETASVDTPGLTPAGFTVTEAV
jgi:hypothetical protein